MTGKLYGVGVGPGDPELMTLKAVRIIKECEVAAVPNTGENEMTALAIAQSAIPGLCNKKILEISMPMTRDGELLNACHTSAAEQIMQSLIKGNSVAFLTLGDPTVYSTYIYVHKKVVQMGGQAEIVPAVPSFCAAAARLGISLAEGAEPLHIIPGSYSGVREGLKLPGTKVLMKTGRAFTKIKKDIAEKNLGGCAKMVQRCGMSGERVFEDLSAAGEDASYFSIIIVKDA